MIWRYIYLPTKFHTPAFRKSFVIVIRPKAEEKFRVTCHADILHSNNLLSEQNLHIFPTSIHTQP